MPERSTDEARENRVRKRGVHTVMNSIVKDYREWCLYHPRGFTMPDPVGVFNARAIEGGNVGSEFPKAGVRGSFRKKPVIVSAVQWLRKSPDCCDQSTGESFVEGVEWDPDTEEPIVRTSEGVMHVVDGDWIIKGVKGEFYPCKDDVFRMTYDYVPESK